MYTQLAAGFRVNVSGRFGSVRLGWVRPRRWDASISARVEDAPPAGGAKTQQEDAQLKRSLGNISQNLS